MILRIFLILTLGLASGGMVLHHVAEDCGGMENCPICQQIQVTFADGPPAVIDLGLCLRSFESLESCSLPASFWNGFHFAATRAPPLS